MQWGVSLSLLFGHIQLESMQVVVLLFFLKQIFVQAELYNSHV